MKEGDSEKGEEGEDSGDAVEEEHTEEEAEQHCGDSDRGEEVGEEAGEADRRVAWCYEWRTMERMGAGCGDRLRGSVRSRSNRPAPWYWA